MYHATNTIVALPDARTVRSDAGYTPATMGFNAANGDQPPFNPDDHAGISTVNGDAILELFGV